MKLAGRVDQPYLVSRVLEGNLPGDPVERMLPIYLPPGYDDEPARRYPVIYVLAGHGGSGPLVLAPSASGESFPERIDRLIRTGKMGAVIAVLPDCWTIFGGAQYVNSSALGQLRGLSQRRTDPLRRCPLPHPAGPGASGDHGQEQRRLRRDGASHAPPRTVGRDSVTQRRHLL